MSQQIESNMASKTIHDNCIESNAETNESLLVISLSDNKAIDGNTCLLIESEVKSSDQKETKSQSQPLMNGQIDGKLLSETVIEIAVEGDVNTTDESNVGSDLVIDCEPKEESKEEPKEELKEEPNESNEEPKEVPKPQSSVKSGPKYIRRTSTEMLFKMWAIIESKEWQRNESEMYKSLIQNMFTSFNIKMNENRIKQMMETALNDKLVIIEEADNQIRCVPNFDPKLFGQLTNDWICFECHSVRDGEDLIDCKKCFKAFHMLCLKGDHKVNDLKEESFNCLYCRRGATSDPCVKVNALPKAELNKCISFVVNNLQLSYDSQIFDSYSIEDSEQNKVLLFKATDITTIRHKALTDQYESLEEAMTDFKHFQHNFIVSKTDDSTKLKEFERRFNHEIRELKLCVDCYKYSSDMSYDVEDDPHDWFTLVCNPPHELVFAKYNKYPYWPAKVIDVKAGGKQYDVRFFDAPDFSRAIVPLQRLRPIEGFVIEDEDNELELPIKLMEKHISKMRANGVYFMPTVIHRSAKKRPNTDPKGSERPQKRSKKSAEK